MDYREDLIRLFRQQGLKITPQRSAVFKLLDGNRSHPTAEEIFSSLKEDYQNLSLTTVYNILKSLKEVGGVQELTIDKERAHFDPDTSLHHHIMCTSCGRIADVHYDQPPDPVVPQSIRSEYTVTGQQINFFGICKTCEHRLKAV